MKKKGDKTKDAILELAKALFSEKGYTGVTMSDFCERSGISRGGLYRHFASTKEIFVAMLNMDRESSLEELDAAIEKGISAKQLLDYFIRQQKKEILNGGGHLSVAVYEFCITEKEQKNYLEHRFAAAVETLEKLIVYGQSKKIFWDCGPTETARHAVIFLEGLKLSSSVVRFEEKLLDEQLGILHRMIMGNHSKSEE